MCQKTAGGVGVEWEHKGVKGPAGTCGRRGAVGPPVCPAGCACAGAMCLGPGPCRLLPGPRKHTGVGPSRTMTPGASPRPPPGCRLLGVWLGRPGAEVPGQRGRWEAPGHPPARKGRHRGLCVPSAHRTRLQQGLRKPARKGDQAPGAGLPSAGPSAPAGWDGLTRGWGPREPRPFHQGARRRAAAGRPLPAALTAGSR